jgi:hypothetical protein
LSTTELPDRAGWLRIAAARTTILELTTEAIIFLLRVLLLAVLYLFLVAVILTISRDVSRGQPDRPVGAARLVVLDPGRTGIERGATLNLRPTTSIGRSGHNAVILDDAYVSSEHAVINFRAGRWWLADRGSTNGTVLNDHAVNGEAELTPGDVIRIGEIRLMVER